MRYVVAGWLALLAAVPTLLRAATGDLDPTFGTGGTVVTDVGARSYAVALLLQPDGRFVAVGTKTSGSFGVFVIIRYLADGSLDPSFGSGGVVTVDPAPTFVHASGAALAPDGSIVAVGMGSSQPDATANASLVMTRVLSDGSVDGSFGSAGLVDPSLGADGFASSVALQPDGRIVATGATNGRGAVYRFLADGTLDPTFGSGGVATPIDQFTAMGALALQPDGKIVAGDAYVGDGSTLVRLNTDGSADPTFGGPDMSGAPVSIVIQADGRILLAGGVAASHLPGRFTTDWSLGRLTADGTADGSLGGTGFMSTTAGMYGIDVGFGPLIPTPDGRLVFVGFGTPGLGTTRALLARFAADGRLDPTFGAAGRVPVAFEGAAANAQARAAVLQPDGKLVIAGSSQAPNAASKVALARVDISCPGAPDSDGDGIGDACDPCTGGVTPSTVGLQVKRIVAGGGEDRLTLHGTATLPSGPAVDLLATGVRLLVENSSGRVVLDAWIPPDAYHADLRVGWKHGTTSFTYRNAGSKVPLIGGIYGVSVPVTSSGIRFTVRGKHGNYPVAPADLPLRASLILTPPRASTRCIEASFTGPSRTCTFNAAGDTVTCK